MEGRFSFFARLLKGELHFGQNTRPAEITLAPQSWHVFNTLTSFIGAYFVPHGTISSR